MRLASELLLHVCLLDLLTQQSVECRQNFINHDDETDPERLQAIMTQARQNAQWVLDKVCTRSS